MQILLKICTFCLFCTLNPIPANTIYSFFCRLNEPLPGNHAGFSFDSGGCGTARAPWCTGRWALTCTNPLTNPHFFQHSGQTIRSACRAPVLSRTCRRSSVQSHASRYQTPQATRMHVYSRSVCFWNAFTYTSLKGVNVSKMIWLIMKVYRLTQLIYSCLVAPLLVT